MKQFDTLIATPSLSIIHKKDRCRVRIEKEGGRWLHQSLMGTDQSMSYKENVSLIRHMEDYVLRFAKQRGFTGVFTCNSNKVNQEICQHYLKYTLMETVFVQDYIHHGKRVFDHVDRDMVVMAMKKYVTGKN